MAATLVIVVFATLFVVFGHATSGARRHVRQVVFPDDNEDGGGSSTRPSSSGGEICLTVSRTRGRCVEIDDCPPLRDERNYDILRQSICGYVRFEPKVCCPSSGGTSRPVTPTRRPTPTRTPVTPTRRPVTPTRRPVTPTNRPVTPTRRPVTRRPVTSRPTTISSSQRDGPTLPKNCGRSNTTGTRIVGGTEAIPGAWPWVVALYIEERGVKSADCGAALISETHVITAAHCVTGSDGRVMSPSVFTARMGEHDLESTNDGLDPVDIPVSKVTRHEQFDVRTYKNDIAILQLSTKVRFTNTIQPICLPYDQLRDEDLTGKKAFVAGWGTTSFNGPSSNKLLEAQFRIWPQADCVTAYRNDLPITKEYMCAGDIGKDSCQGDSGGPLMLPAGPDSRFYQIGVVSFGKKCAQPEFPGVYTNTRLFLEWISLNL